MAERDRCLHCGEVIETINYALGEKVMHIDPAASFPTEHKGTAWWFCRTLVATRDTRTRPAGGESDA